MNDDRAWIEIIDPDDADPALTAAYAEAITPAGTVDNVMAVHSLRPHTMTGHIALYRSVLHHEGNQLPRWFLEAVGSYTSLLNNCVYSATHHLANTRRLVADDRRGERIEAALRAGRPEDAFDGAELALLRYAERLTTDIEAVTSADVDLARTAGASDGDVLEVNQVCGYFNYVNRLLNGLGVSLGDDAIGFYE